MGLNLLPRQPKSEPPAGLFSLVFDALVCCSHHGEPMHAFGEVSEFRGV